jgi:hypothetical protein
MNASEASQVQGEEVYIVGAANSAGQATLYLALQALQRSGSVAVCQCGSVPVS